MAHSRQVIQALPDLESLRCFLAAARTLHFATAAKSVALSPTAFSDRIRRLEEELGAPLFERSTRQVKLTIAGRRLQPHARTLVESAGQLRAQIADPGQTPPFALTLGTRFELGVSWLVPALQPLQAARPERTLHLRFGDSADLLSAVQMSAIDAAITSVRANPAGLEFAPLHEELYVFVGKPGQPPLLDAAQATGHVLLDALPDLPLFRYLIDALPAAAAWNFARTEHLGAIAAVRQRVLQGAGVAVLPHYFVAADLAAGTLVRLLPEVDLPRDRFRLWWRQGHVLRSELLALAEALRAIDLA